MKKGRLVIETIIGIGITLGGYLYCRGRIEGYYNLEEMDLTLSMTILPFLFFLPAYIAGRWIFHYMVCSVHEKAVHMLFALELTVLCVYLAAGIFCMFVKTIGLWLSSGFVQAVYARFIMFGGSQVCSAIFGFLGVLFAFAISEK